MVIVLSLGILWAGAGPAAFTAAPACRSPATRRGSRSRRAGSGSGRRISSCRRWAGPRR